MSVSEPIGKDGKPFPTEPAPTPGAGVALALLLAINLFNYIDRQVLAAVEPEIRKELFPEAVAPDAQEEVKAHAQFRMGLLSTAFLVTYMLTAPLFGWLADRMSRWVLIGIGVTIWSLASGASGIDWGLGLEAAFWMLLATRCFVGIGEAVYGPIAPTVISDLFPLKVRGQKMALFYLAIPVGGALGYAFGEMMGMSWFGFEPLGWRWAFYLVVPPGILLGILSCLMRNVPAGRAEDQPTALRRPVVWQDYLVLARTPSYVFNTLGMTAMTFAIGALAFWMPKYLEDEQVEGLWGLGPRMMFGGITALAGLTATLAGGIAGDRLKKRFSGSYFLVSGAAMLVGFPMLLLVIRTPFPLAWLFVFLTVFCLFFNTGPTNTVLANVTHPAIRATAFAVNILVIHVLGDAISPPLIGWIAGHTSMKTGFTVVSATVLLGGVFWLAGTRHLARDTANAPRSLV